MEDVFSFEWKIKVIIREKIEHEKNMRDILGCEL